MLSSMNDPTNQFGQMVLAKTFGRSPAVSLYLKLNSFSLL
jgi:hypothetical protein